MSASVKVSNVYADQVRALRSTDHARFTAQLNVRMISLVCFLSWNQVYFRSGRYEVDSLGLSLPWELALTFSGGETSQPNKTGRTESDTWPIFLQ